MSDFLTAIHRTVEGKVRDFSPFLASKQVYFEFFGRCCFYFRTFRILRKPPKQAFNGAVYAAALQVTGDFFPSVRRGTQFLLAAKCAAELFERYKCLHVALMHFKSCFSSDYPPCLPIHWAGVQKTSLSPTFHLKLQKVYQQAAYSISRFVRTFFLLLKELFETIFLLSDISLLIRGERQAEFQILTELFATEIENDEGIETEKSPLTKCAEQIRDWTSLLLARCGHEGENVESCIAEVQPKKEPLSPSPIKNPSPLKAFQEACLLTGKMVLSPGKITPFKADLSRPHVAVSTTRFTPIWPEKSKPYFPSTRSGFWPVASLFFGVST